MPHQYTNIYTAHRRRRVPLFVSQLLVPEAVAIWYPSTKYNDVSCTAKHPFQADNRNCNRNRPAAEPADESAGDTTGLGMQMLIPSDAQMQYIAPPRLASPRRFRPAYHRRGMHTRTVRVGLHTHTGNGETQEGG
ncbi:hypothetical protein AB1N83_007410 [Pleurotus pulmonarius]